MNSILINLTDVIYYLDEIDLYDITRQLNDGTVIVGTMHMPKNLDTETHMVKGANIEGKVTIRFEKDDDNQETPYMLQQMDGNDHIYRHKLTWYNYSRSKQCIITNKGPDRNYVLKFIVTDRYDCSGTEYIRFKITKTTNPSLHDLFSDNIFSQTTDEYLLKAKEYNKYKNALGVDNKKRILTKLTRSAYFEGKIDAPIVDTKKIIADIKKKQKELNQQLRKTINIDQIQASSRIVEDDNRYYIYYYKTKGWIFDSYTRIADEVAYIKTVENIEQTLINKVTCKLLNYKMVGVNEIKAMITYINREKPEWDIMEQVLPLLMTIIKNTAKAEQFIQNIQFTDAYNKINILRNSKPQSVPKSLWDAIFDHQLIRYISYYIKDTFGLVQNFH
jgi:hypothetical protein